MKSVLKTLVVCLFLAAISPWPAFAVEPDEKLEDPALEARAREISQHLRCVVCKNQSIDESNAPLARDLRLIIRERLEAGDDNDEVVAFVVDRYGDFVLLRPPMQTDTYLLWFGPALILLGGGAVVFYYFRRVMKPAKKKGRK